MNIPTYQQKDYSFLPNAFQGLQQGAAQFQQGLARTQAIGEKEREMKRQAEYFKKLNLTREEQEKVKDVAITELAVDVHEALELPDTPEGFERARDISIQRFHPFTADEWKNGTGMERIQKTIEGNKKFLTDLKMKTWSQKASGKEQAVFQQQTTPYERKTIQEPPGTVGVEDQGAVKKPLSAFPQTTGEMQQRELKREEQGQIPMQEGLQDTITKESAATKGVSKANLEELWQAGVKAEITNLPEFKQIMEKMGRTSITPITEQQYTAEGLGKPVVPEGIGKLPQEMSEKEKEELRIKELEAKRKGSTTNEQNKNIRFYTQQIAKVKSNSLVSKERENKLRQARLRLKSGKSPDEQMMAILQGIAADPANPKMEEIDAGILRYQKEAQMLQNDISEYQEIITRLGQGTELADILSDLAAERKMLLRKANDYIQSDILPVASQITSTVQIIDRLPAAYQRAMSKAIQEMKDEGALDKDIVDALLRRR